jgi:hypothetical protein
VDYINMLSINSTLLFIAMRDDMYRIVWSWHISLPKRFPFLQNVCSSVFSASAESASLSASTQLFGINVPATEEF